MLFRPSDIENLKVCKNLAMTLNDFYDSSFNNNSIYEVDSKEYQVAENIVFGLYDLILKIDKFFYSNKYVSVDSVNKLDASIRFFINTKKRLIGSKINIGYFFEKVTEFLNKFHEIKEYNGEYDIDVGGLLRKIDEFNKSESLIEKLQKEEKRLLKKIDDLKNKTVHEIFEDDSEKFK